MADPAHEGEHTGIPVSGLSLETITKVAQTIGSVAVAGTVLGAAAFGIGYLAVKQHDEMLGVISTTSYALYVRTGVEFLPKTLHAMALYFGASLMPIMIGVVAVAAAATARAVLPGTEEHPLLGRAVAIWPFIRLVLVASLIIAGVWILPAQLAPLDVINTNLLLDSYHPEYARAKVEASEVYRLLHQPAVDSMMLKSATGHEPAAATLLFMRYGKKALVVAVFVYLTVLVTTTARADATADREKALNSAPLRTTQRKVLEPMLLLLCLVMVLSLPLLFGVMAIPTTLPCVALVTPAVKDRVDSDISARALSDLSGDVSEIVLFRWGQPDMATAYSLERVGTKSVTQVNGDRCEGNVLHEKVTTYTIDSIARARPKRLAAKAPPAPAKGAAGAIPPGKAGLTTGAATGKTSRGGP